MIGVPKFCKESTFKAYFKKCSPFSDEDTKTDKELDEKSERSEKTDSESEHSDEEEEDKLEVFDEDLQPLETQYTENAVEELGQVCNMLEKNCDFPSHDSILCIFDLNPEIRT